MKNLSINNNLTKNNEPEFICDCIKKIGYDTIVNNMDDQTREIVHGKNKVYSQLSFIMAYLRIAKNDLIIG